MFTQSHQTLRHKDIKKDGKSLQKGGKMLKKEKKKVKTLKELPIENTFFLY